MNVLLTGATGFLGSHLARKLVRSGHELTAIRRRSSSLSRVQDIESEIRWFTVNPSGEVDAAAFAGMDVVVHTAATYGRSGEAMAEVAETNTVFSLRILEAAVCHGIRKFINTDSALPPETNPYTLAKAQFAQWGKYACESGKIQFINLRLEHFYGPGDEESKFTCRVIKTCLRNQPELKLTAGTQKRDFIYVADVVDALYLLIVQNLATAGNYVDIPLGSGTATTVRELVETIHQLSQSTTRLVFGAIPMKPNDVMLSCADISMLEELGWKPTTSLREGLELTIRNANLT